MSTIEDLHARQILDSRGKPIVEVRIADELDEQAWYAKATS